jgi:uncharacterized protein
MNLRLEGLAATWNVVTDHDRHERQRWARSVFAGTLALTTTARGVQYRVRAPKTRGDVRELIERGDVRGSSFRFKVDKGGDSWERRGGELVRTVARMLYVREIGPVVTPAYRSTGRPVIVN